MIYLSYQAHFLILSLFSRFSPDSPLVCHQLPGLCFLGCASVAGGELLPVGDIRGEDRHGEAKSSAPHKEHKDLLVGRQWEILCDQLPSCLCQAGVTVAAAFKQRNCFSFQAPAAGAWCLHVSPVLGHIGETASSPGTIPHCPG